MYEIERKDPTFQIYVNAKRVTADLAIYECGWESVILIIPLVQA